MTKEQHQEFIEFALELKWNRDYYSRARIIEELMDKVDELVKNCSIPAVSGLLPIKRYDIDLGGNAMVGIEIKGESLKIFGAMDKRGNGIDGERIKITERRQ